MRVSRSSILALLVLITSVLACMPTPTPPPTLPVPTDAPPTEVPPSPPSDVRGPGFAAYDEIEVTLPETFQGYTLPVDPGNLGNYDWFGFSDAQGALLEQNGFVVTPGEWLEFFQLYENARYEEIPVFVTTDSLSHVYHVLFDKMLLNKIG